MIDRFLLEVREASAEAVRYNRPLLLLVFCHGRREPWEFILNHATPSKGLKIAQLKEAIHPHCRVTMYSTACYSGGWVVSHPSHLHLDVTMLAASSPDHVSNSSWQLSRSIGRACGSIFASTVIDTLTSAASPLLVDSAASGDAENIQPNDADANQVLSYNSFCQSIIDTCSTRVTRLAPYETFTFSAQSDQFDLSWTKRTGIPLTYFKDRWDSLDFIKFNISDPELQRKKYLSDPDPNNPNWLGDASIVRSGGTSIEKEFRLAQDRRDVAGMARAFLKTCPNDWTYGWGNYIRGTLQKFINEKKCPDDDIDIAAMISFQWEAAQTADLLVRYFKLPMPNNEICIMWNRLKWEQKMLAKSPDYRQRSQATWAIFTGKGLELEPGVLQGPPLARFSQYLHAAILEADLTASDADKITSQMAFFMNQIKETHQEEVLELIFNDQTVIQRGRNWLRSIGRDMTRSLPPRKSSEQFKQARDSSGSSPSRGAINLG
jgi:hypothetical protein